MSDRSPRTARTRAALLAAGFDLLVERPIDAIPIDDLVAKAGVAKGSFFNHFKDKNDFAAAIAKEVRLELEALVAKANETVSDPVERIAGGMRVGLEFAIRQPKRSMALLRSMGTPTMREHPLNDGLRADIEAAASRNLLRPEAERLGVLFWLGLCQVLMQDALVGRIPLSEADRRLSDMLVLGLTGLGVPAKRAAAIANKQSVSSNNAV
ncbi:TetR/AcrR family transcriptional regulator [Hyphomonas sp.]|uniref:TetR/AcrR family transcriptional regulator n=1 Tax=Hyphomonas sp. TaxID=87 RepID=UPI0025B88F9E|nr:TetR/AcrR family transcriptional regulator [Hyphomonas sp.]